MINRGTSLRTETSREGNSKRFNKGMDNQRIVYWKFKGWKQSNSQAEDSCNRSCMNITRFKGTIWSKEREVMTRGVNVR